MTFDQDSQPLTFQQKVKKIAEAEWKRFDYGRLKENQNGGWQRVGDYWKAGVGKNRDGRDEYKWSAAFVSWVMKKAGAGDQFMYSSCHSDYIREAIQKRKTNDPSAAFKGYNLDEVAPQVGDLVCFSSGDDVGKVDYATEIRYDSHCDIVVATRPGEIDVIGGNVGKSVSRKTLAVDSQGYLAVCHTSLHWFAVIQNLFQSHSGSPIKMTTYPATIEDVDSSAEYCSANSEDLAMIDRVKGCQVRVKATPDGLAALYTVSKKLPEPPRNTLGMGEQSRDRLGVRNGSDVVVAAQVAHPSFDDATAEQQGEFVERLTDNGLQTGLVVIAPHGGDIEPWTDYQAERVQSQLASHSVSCWRCKGWKKGEESAKRWHITSTDIHERSFPCLNLIIDRHFTHAVSFHGFKQAEIQIDGLKQAEIQIGGCANNALKQEIQQAIQKAVSEDNISVEIAKPNSPKNGDNSKNIVNRLSVNSLTPYGNGIQIEQSRRARDLAWEKIADAVACVYASKLS